MARRRTRHRLVIDGQVLIDDHVSGVGHYTKALLEAFDDLLQDHPDIDARIAVPFKRIPLLAPAKLRRIRPLPIPITLSAQRRLIETGRLPPMDLLLGRGTYFFPNFWRWPLALSPSVTAVHDLSFEKLPHLVDENNGRFLRRVVRESVSRSDRVTALTGTMADEIAEHYACPRGHIDVVAAAVDRTRFYKRSEREIEKIKRTHGIFGEYVLAVGNIEPRKNQTRLIDAFCGLPRELTDDLTLVLVGAGAWREAEIHARVEVALDEGHRVLLLLGRIADSELPGLYSGARCAAYVSLYEGFGMPPLEAMACQTPVVVSDASVMPEVAGGAAILVDPEDVASMTQGLHEIITLDQHERAALVEQGLANAARYSWADSSRALLTALRTAGGF